MPIPAELELEITTHVARALDVAVTAAGLTLPELEGDRIAAAAVELALATATGRHRDDTLEGLNRASRRGDLVAIYGDTYHARHAGTEPADDPRRSFYAATTPAAAVKHITSIGGHR